MTVSQNGDINDNDAREQTWLEHRVKELERELEEAKSSLVLAREALQEVSDALEEVGDALGGDAYGFGTFADAIKSWKKRTANEMNQAIVEVVEARKNVRAARQELSNAWDSIEVRDRALLQTRKNLWLMFVAGAFSYFVASGILKHVFGLTLWSG